ncbi:hypothetical protein [Domibacillus tundrae]|uniref:hypothetical protein n=1 Tax=Domibacillus tundrae TaxID=1587527 RepID=UPI000617AEA3|nr:hypothetical protein [Domibacillus tundrae]
MIHVSSLLAYFKEHPDYKVKTLEDEDINIEYKKSTQRRKNVLAELCVPSGRFYLRKDNQWVNIKDISEVQTNAEVIAWVEKDSRCLG